MSMKIGMGFDIHPLSPGRDLVLGGIKIDYQAGLAGHSDADVVVHAISDALLGALGLGDIGEYFPDTDPAYKGISSLKLLDSVMAMVRKDRYRINNLDLVIIANAPKLSPYKQQMKEKIAAAIGCDSAFINIKASTTNGFAFPPFRGGAMGSSELTEGIATYCVLLLEKEAT